MIYKSFNVLLVEDMLMIAKITEQMLKKSLSAKYTVTHKTRLADSLVALKAQDFDVVLLDLNLLDSRNLDTLLRVVEFAPEVPVIVLTASADDDVGLLAVQAGAQDFLLKGDFNYLTLDRAIIYSIERHRLQRTIRQLAVIDELTGLYNRRGFNTTHPDVLQRVRTGEASGYLCFFDLDRFKQINDTLGHKKGDEALVEFAATLRSVFRKDALLARFGGDEFVAMGIDAQAGQAEEAIKALEVVLSVRNLSSTAEFRLESSAGTINFEKDDTRTIEQLMAAADSCLYLNKQARKRAAGVGRADEVEMRS